MIDKRERILYLLLRTIYSPYQIADMLDVSEEAVLAIAMEISNTRKKHSSPYRGTMAVMLNVEQLPNGLVVHHIDGNHDNNQLDNLCVVTAKGHSRIHARENKLRAEVLKLKSLAQQYAQLASDLMLRIRARKSRQS